MIEQIRIQPELEKAFTELGFLAWTDIQQKTIPLIQQGKDVIAQSHTGSGKTAAFGFPILEKTFPQQGLQALILVPTRELCEQVTTEIRKFSKHKRLHITAVYGGVSIHPQMDAIIRAEIVVGTPGRILDHLSRGTLPLKKIRTLVLDEADKMFEMGFIDDVKEIISHTPSERQTLLFSATIPHQVHDLVRHYMKHPEKVKVQEYVDKGKLTQHYYDVDQRDKFSLLVHVLKHRPKGLTIVFCATRNRIDIVSRNLYKQGITAQKIHGGLSQNRRKEAIDMLHANKADILVASDVAARGLDIKGVDYVINYDVPKTAKEYIHRIGRTARAGREGAVVTLLSQQDHDNFSNVVRDPSLQIHKLNVPPFERVPFYAHPAPQQGGFHRNAYHHQRTFSHQRPTYGRSTSSSEERPRYGNQRGYHGQRSGYQSSDHRNERRPYGSPHHRRH